MSKFLILSIAALLFGGIGWWYSDKNRQPETDEWSSGLQWSYLLIMIGVFGVLSQYMSFTAVLLIFTLITGVVWLINRYNIRKAQQQNPDIPYVSYHAVDYLSGFFPIILVIFILRTFVVEPFVIPSSSMRPGLVPGDFVLVNKFSYGIRTPIINNVIIPINKVQRGDVVVFNYPLRPEINYIKRIVGVGGDVVDYHDKILTINGEVIQDKKIATEIFPMDNNHAPIEVKVLTEELNGKKFKIYQVPEANLFNVDSVLYRGDACQYDEKGFTCKVPQGQYFAMGDNRDNSADSRYWGFVDDRLIVGKALFVWMSYNNLKRIGTNAQHP